MFKSRDELFIKARVDCPIANCKLPNCLLYHNPDPAGRAAALASVAKALAAKSRPRHSSRSERRDSSVESRSPSPNRRSSSSRRSSRSASVSSASRTPRTPHTPHTPHTPRTPRTPRTPGYPQASGWGGNSSGAAAPPVATSTNTLPLGRPDRSGAATPLPERWSESSAPSATSATSATGATGATGSATPGPISAPGTPATAPAPDSPEEGDWNPGWVNSSENEEHIFPLQINSGTAISAVQRMSYVRLLVDVMKSAGQRGYVYKAMDEEAYIARKYSSKFRYHEEVGRLIQLVEAGRWEEWLVDKHKGAPTGYAGGSAFRKPPEIVKKPLEECLVPLEILEENEYVMTVPADLLGKQLEEEKERLAKKQERLAKEQKAQEEKQKSEQANSEDVVLLQKDVKEKMAAAEVKESQNRQTAATKYNASVNVFLHPGRSKEDKAALAGTGVTCARCSTTFDPETDLWGSVCRFHPGKLERRNHVRVYTCCEQKPGHEPCEISKTHVFVMKNVYHRHNCIPYRESSKVKGPDTRKAVGMDCEMAYTSLGLELIRLTVIDFYTRETLIDRLVKPQGELLDLNTRYSGIADLNETRPEKGGPAVSFNEAHELLSKYVNRETILIGHALNNDLNALRLVHRRIVDTSILYPVFNSTKVSLKRLAVVYLNREIQVLTHDSLEDTVAAMDIVKLHVEDPSGDEE